MSVGQPARRQEDVVVQVVPVEVVLPLRAAVLNPGTPRTEAIFEQDARPDALHLAAFPAGPRHQDGSGDAIGCASAYPEPWPGDPSRPAWLLRGMAVRPERQGTGVGRALLDALAERARAAGATLLWANARDSALGFYEHEGWQVDGDGFVHPATALPHHVVRRDLG